MHTRLHAYAHSPIHRHNRTRTHTNTHMHETALVSYPMSKQTEMRGSGWVVDTTIVVPCPALECDAISNPSSAGMLACFVCLFFFFFCAMVGVTCQNRKLLRWTPHCAHPIVSFSSSSFHKLKFAVVSCIFSCPAVLESRMRHSAQ